MAEPVELGPRCWCVLISGRPSWQEKGHQARQGLDLWGVQASEVAQQAGSVLCKNRCIAHMIISDDARDPPLFVNSPGSRMNLVCVLAACPKGALLLQLLPHAHQTVVGPSHEGIEQTFLDTVRFPNSCWLKPNAFLGGRLSRIAEAVENPTAVERAHFHSELDDGLSQTLLNLSPPNKLP
jgi:hypothetical protein